jgi:hypothetical protein
MSYGLMEIAVIDTTEGDTRANRAGSGSAQDGTPGFWEAGWARAEPPASVRARVAEARRRTNRARREK